MECTVEKARSSSSNLRGMEEAYRDYMGQFHELHIEWSQNHISDGPCVSAVCHKKFMLILLARGDDG